MMPKSIGITPFQSYIYKSRYARWLPDKSRREDWAETVHRYIEFISKRIPEDVRENTVKELEDAILNFEVMPSMRAMMTAGKALEKDEIAAYNCSYLAIDDPRAFDEAMYISMCGVGLGFSVERQYVNQLPIVAENFFPVDTTIKVRDSKIGWASGFRQLIALLYGGSVPSWDLSSVRPAGSPLKTFGGRASGPEPLDRLFKFTVQLFKNAAGRKLTSLECHDLMCFVADIVVSGGVRRSAMISLSNLSDDRMRGAKGGQWWIENPQRALANNSAVYTEKPEIGVFMKEWLSLYESRSGERGIYNRAAAIKKAQAVGRRKWKEIDFGVNPCISRKTWIHTANGPDLAENLIGRKFTAIVDGEPHPSSDDGFFITGVKPVFLVRTTRGYELEATDDHKILIVDYLTRKARRTAWKTVGELIPGDRVVLNNHRDCDLYFSGPGTLEEGWLLGNLKGDGNIQKNGRANLDFWGDNRLDMVNAAVEIVHTTVGGRSDLTGCDQPQHDRARVGSTNLGQLANKYGFTRETHKALTPLVEFTSFDFHRGFLQGWFDADGSVQGDQEKGVSIRLSSSDLPGLKTAQRMLLRLGIASTVYPERRPAGVRILPDGKGGNAEYWCQADHELVISNDNMEYFAVCVGFKNERKQQKLLFLLQRYVRELNKEQFFSEVIEVVSLGEKEVLDCQIPSLLAFDANGFYAHNCGEIILRSRGLCNLTEVIVRPDDTKESLKGKIRIASILGTLQSTLTDFRYLRKDWQKNAEEERLLGVSLSGIMDCKMTSTNNEALPILLDELRNYSVEVNAKWAEKLGINPSVAVTCVKPSGTVSQLVNCSPGIHTRYSDFLMRTIREDRKNPIGAFLKTCGVPCEPEQSKPNDVDVFYFPLASPEGSVTRNALTAVQQLELYLTYRQHWTEHNPSCTIYIKDSEWLEVAAWVYRNFDNIGGVAFLPHTDHIYKQAPYTELTEQQYLDAAAKMPVIDWSKLAEFESEDHTTAMKEYACSNGSCAVV